jgi:uncharacterized membrane protein
MTDVEKPGLALPFSIAVSAFGFFTILALALHGTGFSVAVTWRKPIIGSTFALVCFLGIVLALSPRKCSETVGHHRKMKITTSSSQTSNSAVVTRGHHYDCGKFSSHTMQVDGHVVCAACTGLFLGALGALFGTVLYFFVGRELPQIGFLPVLIGVAAMILGFLQLKSRGFARSLLNMGFVLGAYLILAGIDELAGSLLVDLFSIALIVFWLFTRILLSQWDHWRICKACLTSCEIRDKRKEGLISSTHSVKSADYD